MTQPNPPNPIEELDLVIASTRGLSVQEQARLELVTKLRDIAAILPASLQYAETCAVANAADAEHAASSRQHMVEKSQEADKLLREFDNGLIDRLFKTHRAWTKLIASFTTPLEYAAKTVKAKIIVWQEAEAEKARQEQVRLQAEADERARKERERLEKQAEKLKTPELKEQRLEQAQAVVAPVIQVAAPKIAVKAQKRWTVTSVDKAVFLAAAATDKNLQGFIEINQQALARSKAANSQLEVPGIIFGQITV